MKNSWRRAILPTSLAVASICLGSAAHGADRLVLGQGGGLPALSVEVDLPHATVHVRTCPHGSPCDGPVHDVPITLASSELPAAKDVSVESIAIGDNKHVAHVRIPSASDKDRAFEAVVAATDGAVIYEGITGYSKGTPGDREGERVTITDRGDGTQFVLVSRLVEGLRQCGDAETPIIPNALDPKTLTLRRATLRIPKDARDAATPVVATRAAEGSAGPLVSPLSAAAGTSGEAPALVDSDPKNAWIEGRPNDGRGEFVTTRTLANVPIQKLRFVVAPDPLPQGYAAPRTFYVKTTGKTFAITIPEDAALHPGAAYDVSLPEPVSSECLTVVLDESYAKKDDKAPNVGIAELSAFTPYDKPGASLADLVAGLSGPDENAREAVKNLLSRAGKNALGAVDQAYPKLDADGRMAAMDVMMSGLSCTEAGALLVRGYLDADRRVRSHGEKRLERCGRASGPALLDAWKNAKGVDAARLSDLLATLAPDLALGPLATRLGAGTPAERGATRTAFGAAARNAKPDALAAALASLTTDDARVELFRAAGPRAADLGDAGKKTLAELGAKDDFRLKWLLSPAFAALAEAGDADARAWLVARLGSEKEWPLRARAAELWPKSAAAEVYLTRACEDSSPRVREAVLKREGEADSLVPCAQTALVRDTWPFVRVSAAHTLARGKPSTQVDASLAVALSDASTDVRVAAANALGERRATTQSKALIARLSDGKEDSLVRVAAARALGNSCAGDAVPALTSFAKDAALPQGAGQDIAVSMAAILALGAIHPPDVQSRLSPLLQKGVPTQARAAAQHAIADQGSCAAH